jgi:ankyrin repeat protein
MLGKDVIEAAKAGDKDRVRELLGKDPSLVGLRAESGETPVMTALYHGHRDLAMELADAVERSAGGLDLFAAAALGRLPPTFPRGVSVNDYAYDGWTPLHLAAFFGQHSAAERLLAAGADLAAISRNSLSNTALHAAVAGGHVDVSLLLLERGADVHAVDAGGHTPLHIAAEAGSLPVVRALLARGADPHAVDAEDKTPLSRAAARNHTEIVDVINVDR